LVEKAELHDFTPSRRRATASLCADLRARTPREDHAAALSRLCASLHNACRYGKPAPSRTVPRRGG